jgi:hypothetical protein
VYAIPQNYGDSGHAATLLSLQVLLALSPLHQQLLPLKEQLPMFPASFGPAVNKLLMSQLGLRQLLQREVEPAGQPLMWHVWWHIGVRRYHWVQQQQQQQGQQEDEEGAGDSEQQQQQNAASAVSKSSKARSKQKARKQQQQQQALAAAQQAGLQPLTAGQLSALYADPAARYYAAGFAARQTAAYGVGIRARAALQTPHLTASHGLWLSVSADRFKLCGSTLGSSLGLEDPLELQVLLQVTCDAQFEHEHAPNRPLFPPLFRPELQLGVCAAGRLPSPDISREAGLVNREGELLRLMPGAALRKVLEVQPHRWQVLHEQLVPGCDCCHKAFQKQKLQVEDDSSDDDGQNGVSV